MKAIFFSLQNKDWKKFSSILYGIRTQDLYDTDAVLYQLS